MEDISEDAVADPGEMCLDLLSEGTNREDAHHNKLYNGVQLVLGDIPYTVEDMRKRGVPAKQPDMLLDGRRYFECEICSRSFSDPSNLRRHKNIHTGQRPYSCEICSKTFRQKSQLDRHRLVHTGVRPFQCAFCPKGFRDSTELKVHYRKHTGERPYKCELCPRGFSRVSYLKRHEETHKEVEEAAALEETKGDEEISSSASEDYSVPGKFKCSICNLSFYKKSVLEVHRPKHYKIGPTGQKLYECAVCKKCFNNSSNLHKHAIIHSGLKPFTCTICDQRFRQATHLERHYMVHTGERPYKCSICPKGFRDTSDLLKHQHVHKGEKPYHCPICMKSFTHLHNANGHRKKHLAPGCTRLRLPSLSWSPQSNSTSSSKHVKLALMVRCLMCGLELKTQREVQTHCCKLLSKAHQKARKCDFCAKIFTSLAGLRRHYLTHATHKQFTCHLCNKTFRQLSRLEKHKRTHTEFRFQCPICEKAFSESSDLTKHQQEHIRAKMLKCELCSKTFSRMFLLSKHLLTHGSDPRPKLLTMGGVIEVDDDPS
ncbi:zinc finger protein 595-like [Ambystoma mexicanum]|uniref:zinc finger protein 595-like n=1 Tax=Ambystoma mexicanum TaxID=8296 RepID=UPI0037E919A5